MMIYDAFKDDPKTVEEYITYIVTWLSGDSGWDEKSVEELMREFVEVVRNEAREEWNNEWSDWDSWD